MTRRLHSADGGRAAPKPAGSDPDAITNRLRQLEEQVRALQGMVDDEAACIDVLTQIAAAQSALEQVAASLVEDHVHRWAALAMAEHDPARAKDEVDELMAAVRRFAKHH